MKKRGQDFLVRQAREAERLGHTIRIETRDRRDEFPEQGYAAIKIWALCSCGYRSRPSSLPATALAAGFRHVGGVVADAQSLGVSVPAAMHPAL